jgi:1,4-alpha-glucan branching enzyme
VIRENYRIGVPKAGVYNEIFNSDSSYYDGSNIGTGVVTSEPKEWMGQLNSLNLTLPPLGGVILKL